MIESKSFRKYKYGVLLISYILQATSLSLSQWEIIVCATEM